MKQRPKVNYFNNDDYGFKYNSKYSDDSGDEVDLPIRNAYKPQQFVEADILDGDTLQAIALRFNCSVAALKNANNIHKENEIHARRKIKIPIKAFSLLTENLPSVHTSGNNSPTKVKDSVSQSNGENDPLNEDLQEKLIVASVNSAEVRISTKPSENRINNLKQAPHFSDTPSTSSHFVNSENIISDDGIINDESIPLILEGIHEETSLEDIVLKEFNNKGADLGLKWIHLLIFVLLLCVIIPLFYVYYIAEHPEKYHHHHS